MNSLFPLSESWCLVTYESTLRTSTPVTRFQAHPWDDYKYMCFIPLNVQLSTLNLAAKFSQQEVGCLSIERLASESAFSTSGRVLSIRRTRLTPTSLEMCMCLKDHLDAQEYKQDKSTFETPVDFEKEILDAEVQANEAIPLSDEEIALDAASSEGSMSGPDSGGEEAKAEVNYGYDVNLNDYKLSIMMFYFQFRCKWVAEIRQPNGGKKLWLGTFGSAVEGALAYDEVARAIYGLVVRINLPNYCPNASLTASSCDSIVACSQSESNEVHIDEFLGVMGEYECSQAQGLKTAHNKGQYDAWFENNVDGFDFDFLDMEFEDYNFTLEDLGISLDPAEPVM
nr:drought responsive element binding protein [Tanacetum cinerariifolium]